MACNSDTIRAPVASPRRDNLYLACIDLYAGVGSVAQHLSIAGITVSLSVESDGRVAAVAMRNSDHEILNASVEDPAPHRLLWGGASLWWPLLLAPHGHKREVEKVSGQLLIGQCSFHCLCQEDPCGQDHN